jgi:hypothetical protein
MKLKCNGRARKISYLANSYEGLCRNQIGWHRAWSIGHSVLLNSKRSTVKGLGHASKTFHRLPSTFYDVFRYALGALRSALLLALAVTLNPYLGALIYTGIYCRPPRTEFLTVRHALGVFIPAP